MRYTTARRGLAGLGVVTALLAVTAAPAFAATPQLRAYLPDATIAVGTPGVYGSPIIYASEPTVLEGLTATFDLSGLSGVAEVSADDTGSEHCASQSAERIVCTMPFEIGVGEWGTTGEFNVLIAPAKGAAEGATGKLKVTVEAAGLAPVSHEAKIRVGEGVDLAAGRETIEVKSRPGGSFTGPLALRNVGETDADGAVAVFFNDYGIRATDRHSNCTYEGEELRTCTFDQTFAAGVEYDGELAYRLGEDTYAPGAQAGEVIWLTVAEFEDFAAYLDSLGVSIGSAGSGDALSLAEAGTLRANGVQADVDPSNNWSTLLVNVKGNNGVDLAAVGDELTGAAGATVTATVGLVNNGPATADSSRSGGPVTNVEVRVPAGTTAVEVPDNCVPFKGAEDDGEAGQPGKSLYRCWASSLVKAGDGELMDFELRIDKVIANAAGLVTVNAKCLCEGRQEDLDASNDVAKILINPSGGAGGGGGLPITGAPTVSLIVVGTLLLLGGAVGFLAARRRRVRFTA